MGIEGSPTMMVVRPYHSTMRTRVFALLESAGLCSAGAQRVEPGTPDDDALAAIVEARPDVLLIPFHAHRDQAGNRLDGLTLSGRLHLLPDAPQAPILMPITPMASASLRLADSKAANGITLEVERLQRQRRLLAQRRIVAALHDAEHRAFRPLAKGRLAALGPAMGAFQRLLVVGAVSGRRALVEHHGNVRPQRLFDLHDQVMIDVPFPGGAYPKTTYEQWRAWAIDSPTSDHDGMFVAKQGDDWVGLTFVEMPPGGSPFTGSTGVLRAHRGRGLAMALKLRSFRFLREHGYHQVRAHNDTANPPILELNRKLGYRRLPGWITWEKTAQ